VTFLRSFTTKAATSHLCPSSASPCSGCAHLQCHYSLSWERICVIWACSSFSSLTTRLYAGTHQCSKCYPQPRGDLCLKLLYLSNGCFSAPLRAHFAPGVRRCSAISSSWRGNLCSLGGNLFSLSLASGLCSNHQLARVLRGGIAAIFSRPRPLSRLSTLPRRYNGRHAEPDSVSHEHRTFFFRRATSRWRTPGNLELVFFHNRVPFFSYLP
jgi:hypothetical protein